MNLQLIVTYISRHIRYYGGPENGQCLGPPNVLFRP